VTSEDKGCLGVFLFVIAIITGICWWNFTSEIDARAYQEIEQWTQNPSSVVRQKIAEAAADKQVTEWEYYWINRQKESDDASSTHAAARQKALDAIKPQ
jgi:hypothetical protein